MAQFLTLIEMKEGEFLEQRLRAIDNKLAIQNSAVTEDLSLGNSSQDFYELSPVSSIEDEADGLNEQEDWLDSDQSEELEVYGEY